MSLRSKSLIIIFTLTAVCAFKPGGIGVLVIDRENKKTQEICEGYTSTTNNRVNNPTHSV